MDLIGRWDHRFARELQAEAQSPFRWLQGCGAAVGRLWGHDHSPSPVHLTNVRRWLPAYRVFAHRFCVLYHSWSAWLCSHIALMITLPSDTLSAVSSIPHEWECR